MASARKFTTSSVDRGRSLADYLAERLGVSRAEAESLVQAGAVFVGRRRAEDPARALQPGERVAVHASDGREEGRVDGDRFAPHSALDVVYEDAEVLVVHKPAGVASQATRSSSAGALDRMVTARHPEARLLHRIDREASGLVLFTRGQDAHRRFAELLARRELIRIYQAVVWGHIAEERGELADPIGPDPRDRRRMAAGVGRPAQTGFRVLARGHTPAGEATSLLELQLVTGRTHQIRVHLSHHGHPICGDSLYGRPGARALDRLYLHAHLLRWPGGPSVVAPIPPSFADLVGCSG